ncbi:hypothetical protein EDS67_06150 [candidate division KSB1 bacterium]|nr:MAG: hypothetical protein EDS67_06150 [candidate division KSB1 bacterium]MBC6949174.1 hypothetical protein [candidate division KSB1 bacterium]MCE7940276.1 hypothetical protein [Chlorobi bacterium CHB1]
MAESNTEKIICQEKFLIRMALILRMLDNQQFIDLVSGDLCDSGRWRLGEWAMPSTNCFSVTSARWQGNFSLTSGVKSSIFLIQIEACQASPPLFKRFIAAADFRGR